MKLNAITMQNKNFASNINYANKKQKNYNILQTELYNDKLIYNSEKGSKVSLKEGIGILGKGFTDKIKNMAVSIIKQPVKTMLTIGTVSLLITGASLIGIASATAGSFLALGFSAFAASKAVIDLLETVKDQKEGRYNEVREDLHKIGGDGVDIALSAPFVPKALNQVSRFSKYGKNAVQLNTELISNLKNCNNFSDINLEFAKADTLINYEMIGNEIGLAVKPNLSFRDIPVKSQDCIIGGTYEPACAEIQINKNILTGKGRYLQISAE